MNKQKEWEKYLKSAYISCDDISKNIKNVLEMIIFFSFGEKIGSFYKLLGDDLFFKVIDEFGENTVEFPSKDEIKDMIITAMVYYYKEVMGFNWERIQELLPYEKDVGLRYNRKINKINKDLKKKLNEFYAKSNNDKCKNEDDIFHQE